ncbi:hypothetical protein ACTJJ0_22240 [Chitinophaga sp. 22321]|uniref:hypothetical protein n=1 Tax=Chitinophaga sp. 22321 TaxID=3453909 RepID=UPI003F8576B8
MDVKAWVFCKLYELLRDKFITELNPKYVKKKSSLKLWYETFNTEGHPFFGQNKAHIIFDINEIGDYFYEKYQLALTSTDTIPIKENRIFKAFRFINDPEPWTPEKHKAYPKLSQEEIDSQAVILYDEFEKKKIEEAAKQKEKSKDKRSNDEIEKEILHLVTVDLENFVPNTVTTLVNNFFEALNNKKYDDAWTLMTANAHEQYIFDGKYKDFVTSFSAVKTYAPTKIYRILYGFQELKFNVSYIEEGDIWDFAELIDIARNKDKTFWVEAGISIDQINTYYNSVGYKFNLATVHKMVWSNFHFQKILFSKSHSAVPAFILNDWLLKKSRAYRKELVATFSLKSYHNRWLIDSLGEFTPSHQVGILLRAYLSKK